MQVFGHVKALLENLTSFYDCLFAHGMFLPRDVADEAATYLENAGDRHQSLTLFFMNQGPFLFGLTEKAHFTQHLAIDVRDTRFNPRFAWTYSDEDWMGRIASIGKACTRGRGPIRVGAPIVERWRNRMHVAWKMRGL